ncbi:response regulator transcription factor [Streptomyces javensis]|uniref:helix-turn-helix transcriptional regulator n=1 Tax=Streptomyces javensis TaxID=114698 RepID=UPI003411715D
MHGSHETPEMEHEKRIPVVVHARDPISREGTISQLRRHPEVSLVDEAGPHDDGVVVLIADSLDQTLLSQLRGLVRGEGRHPVLVISQVREAALLDIVECGVDAVVWRHEATSCRLLRAVTAAFHGHGHLPADLLDRLIDQGSALRPGAVGDPGAQVTGLASREIDVLRLLSEGMDTREIAGKLCYSERTVKHTLQRLTTRLKLRNRTHAVAHALREGYIS